jgi:hypothetical protein
MFTTTPGFPLIDADPVLAETMRRRLFDRAVSDKALVTSYHFQFPAVGKIVADGAGYTFVRRWLVSAVRKSSIGELGILTPRPPVRREADKVEVEQMPKCVLAVQDALDIEKDEPFDSDGQRRLRNVPADPG